MAFIINVYVQKGRMISIIETTMGSRRGPQCEQPGIHWHPRAKLQLADSAANANFTGGLRGGAIRILMEHVARYINRILFGRVARYKNRVLFGSDGHVLHVYIIGSGRPYSTGRWGCSM